MEKSMDIPQDIIDNVIAAVGDDTRLLKQCTLVSSSFLFPSRKHLFSRITLRSDQSCQGIHHFLVENSVMQSFVRSITLTQDNSKSPEWMNGKSLLAILRLPFCCLERFSIIMGRDYWTLNPWDWNSFNSELKDALSNIIHSSTLKCLSLTGITKVPITFFLHIIHITTLELHSIAPIDFYDENSSSLRAVSKGMTPMASHAVIDRCVWVFGWEHVRYEIRFIRFVFTNSGRRASTTTESIFLPFMCRLRFLEIYISLGSVSTHNFNILSFLMGSLCISLTSPATLEHLKLNIRFRGHINNFTSNTFYENLRDADAWRHLDSIATHSTGSQLQRVDINIDYAFRCVIFDEDEVEKAVFDGLPLLRTKGILFVEAFLAGFEK